MTKEYYHRLVYIPNKVLFRAIKQLNKACKEYSMLTTKHFTNRVKQRKIDLNTISIDNLRNAKIMQIEVINGFINKLILKYNTGDKDLYVCVCINECLLLVTAYTHNTDYKYCSKQDLINTGKYITRRGKR